MIDQVKLKVHEVSSELVTEERSMWLLRPCNASVSYERLVEPQLWTDDVERIVESCSLESPQLQLLLSRPQLDYLSTVFSALTNPVVAVNPFQLQAAAHALNLQVFHPSISAPSIK